MVLPIMGRAIPSALQSIAKITERNAKLTRLCCCEPIEVERVNTMLKSESGALTQRRKAASSKIVTESYCCGTLSMSTVG